MRWLSTRVWLGLTVTGMLAGCSALISPDKDELGSANLGGDGGGGGTAGRADSGADLCAAGCAIDQRCNPARGCVPIACRDDLDCNDGSSCNGVEVCTPGSPAADTSTGCVAGVPTSCDDGLSCTIDSCDSAKGCLHMPNDPLCDDGIFCTKDACSAAGTAGTSGCVHTPENSLCGGCYLDGVCSPAAGGCEGRVPKNCSDGSSCTSDTCDDALGMCMNSPRDDDGDGNSPMGCPRGDDCDDNDAAVHPGAAEVCDKEDDNCNGVVDEGCLVLPDTCATKQVVTLVSGRAVINGTLSDFQSNYTNKCGQSGGLDAVYAIPVEGTSDIVIDSEGSSARVVLAVAESCADGSFGTDACAASISRGNRRTRLMLHRYTPPAAGSMLYLLVDGAGAGEKGGFTITVEVTAAKGDACDDVMDLGACGTMIGYVSSLIGQERGSCQSFASEAQPESILRVDGPADGSLQVSVASGDFAPVLYARSECDNADSDLELGCDTSGGGPGGQSGRAELNFEADPGSDVYLVVDGAVVGASYLLRCVP